MRRTWLVASPPAGVVVAEAAGGGARLVLAILARGLSFELRNRADRVRLSLPLAVAGARRSGALCHHTELAEAGRTGRWKDIFLSRECGYWFSFENTSIGFLLKVPLNTSFQQKSSALRPCFENVERLGWKTALVGGGEDSCFCLESWNELSGN
jgi:hypothetical protein